MDERPQPPANALASVPYFSPLTPTERAAVAARAQRRAIHAGEVLFVEGGPCAGLFIVLSGLVKLYKSSPDGKEQVVRHMGPGDSFNEVPVFDGGPNPVSAAVVEQGEVIEFSREAVLELLRAYPAFGGAVVHVFASRLRHLITLVEDLSFRQVTARVARVLLQSIDPHEGMGAGAGVRARVTQREIAEMAGTSREVVARALKALEGARAIEVHRGHIQISDPTALRTLS
jgi:CRP/FNR family transcriptional regulator